VIAINDRRTGKPYRYVKGDGNYCYEIFLQGNGHWDGEVINTFTANTSAYQEFAKSPEFAIASWQGLPLVMRIRKGDVLLTEQDGSTQIMRIVKFSDGKIEFASHQEANVAARAADRTSGFKYTQKSPSKLKSLRARIAGIDILGFVNDPGFRE
jgi:CRISPR-associated endonuclease Csn1